MKIFSFLGQKKLNPEWTYSAHGSIWRILFSPSGRLVGECRDHRQKSATLFCLDEKTGSPVWQDLRLNEPWWIGIDAVYHDTVVVHEFANPGLPEHKGIIVLGLEQGNELWRNSEMTFWFAYKESVYAYKPKFEKRIGYRLSLHSGAVEEEFGDALDDLQALRKLALDEQQADDFLFPEILENESSDPLVAALVAAETGGAIVHGGIECIRSQHHLLFNYYTSGRASTPESPVLENRFVVFDMQRQAKIYTETLAVDAKAPTPDSFFIKGRLVYFIKNQNILTALALEP